MIPSLKVETPATTTSSKSVCPSTSKLPVKVVFPATDKLVLFNNCKLSSLHLPVTVSVPL